jgi:hypothetical protein
MNVYVPHTPYRLGREHRRKDRDRALQNEAGSYKQEAHDDRSAPAVGVRQDAGRDLEDQDRHLERRPEQHEPQ